MQYSIFGSECVAFPIASELIKSLCFKLRMFGILYDGPAKIYVTMN